MGATKRAAGGGGAKVRSDGPQKSTSTDPDRDFEENQPSQALGIKSGKPIGGA
jgi:hypothetical protein